MYILIQKHEIILRSIIIYISHYLILLRYLEVAIDRKEDKKIRLNLD